MTSSVPGDSMSSLHPDDIFLVNRAVDGDGNYETYKVEYSEVSKAVTGATGGPGATGATGPQGLQGPAGTSVKVLGTFNDYDDLLEFASLNGPGGTNTIEEGDIYVVYDDWTDANWPGRDFCKAGQSVEADNCQINVAYVWALKADGTNDMFVRLGPLTGERGPTGPYFDEVIGEADDQTAAGGQYDYKITFKDNNDYSGDPSGFTGLDDQELLIEDIQGATGSTGPYYDTIYISKDTIEEDGVDSQGNTKYKKDFRITFDRSDASDPDNALNSFETLNLIGATGPGVGEKGDPGPTGPFWDIVEFEEEDEPNYSITDYPGDTPYGAVYSIYKDSSGILSDQKSVNIRGPRGPRGEITNIDELVTLLPEVFPPVDGDDGDAPWVHKGKNCNDAVANVDENVYGQKTFRHTIGFEPCNVNTKIMHWKIGGERDVEMYFQRDLRGSSILDGFSLKRRQTQSPGLTVGFESGSGSPQIGIKVLVPYYGVDIKGVCAAQQFIARPNPGQKAKAGDFVSYRVSGIDSARENFDFKRNSEYGGPCRYRFVGSARLEYRGQPGGLKIEQSKLYNGASKGFLRLDGDQVKYSSNSSFSIPSISDENTVVMAEFDGSRALEVVKVLKPRIVKVDDDNVILAPVKEDIQDDVMGELRRTPEGNPTVETLVSMLILSIQKLEERISVLESA